MDMRRLRGKTPQQQAATLCNLLDEAEENRKRTQDARIADMSREMSKDWAQAIMAHTGRRSRSSAGRVASGGVGSNLKRVGK